VSKPARIPPSLLSNG